MIKKSNAEQALDKLEEMWDRQIMKGDEEFLEEKLESMPQKAKEQQRK